MRLRPEVEFVVIRPFRLQTIQLLHAENDGVAVVKLKAVEIDDEAGGEDMHDGALR
jgi:hypothetical protein